MTSYSLRRFLLSQRNLLNNLKGATSTLRYTRQASYTNEKETHFGYKKVGEEEKRDKVLEVFHNVADKYDLMNDAMSAGVHRLWKDHFMKRLNPGPKTSLLDVAGGTGDISFRFLDYVGKNHVKEADGVNEDGTSVDYVGKNHVKAADGTSVVVCDINASMLQVGEARARSLGYTKGISWKEGDAQNLPFDDNSFDAYTIAFGIRNVVRLEEALSEAYRVLKPGGRFMCLEFSKVTVPGLDILYDVYSFQVIPPLGKVLAGDWDSYQYLVESIRQFPDQQTFEQLIKNAGFRCVTHENLTAGVAAIHSGFKL